MVNLRTSLSTAYEVWGKVMFLHLTVILFTGRGCGCLVRGGGCCLVRWGLPFFRGGLPFFKSGLPFFRWGLPFSLKWETPTPPSPIQEYGQCAVGTHPTGMHTGLITTGIHHYKNFSFVKKLIQVSYTFSLSPFLGEVVMKMLGTDDLDLAKN